jgi:hypothetical protein
MVANAQLAQCCQAVTLAESQREAAVMAVLVEGLLSERLGSGGERARSRALQTVAREVFDDGVEDEGVGWVEEVIARVVRDAERAGDAAEIRACDAEVIRARLSLYRWLSVWRRVAVDHLESSLAELLALTHVAEASFGSVGTPVDEALCERVLGDVDVLIERCREFGGDEDLCREALDGEADAFADEVAERFTLSRGSGETAE